jgi:hypothetical protein
MIGPLKPIPHESRKCPKGNPNSAAARHFFAKVVLGRVDKSGRFHLDPNLPWRLCFLEDIDARDYVESDRLELDDLSQR